VDAAARLKRVEDQLKALPPDPPVTADSQDNSAVTVRLQILDREAKRLGEEQKRISAQMGGYRAKVDAVPVREQEMAELNRNYSVSKDHYQSLLDKNFSAGMAADLERKQQSEHFTILDSALVPEKPFKPNRRAMLIAAVLAALAASLGLAYLKDMLDGSLKVEAELRGMLPAGVPLLTIVPQVQGSADRRRALTFAVVAGLVAVAGCLLEVGLYLKLRPIL
jgi:uncharacterized protein involved in exopolysaccharide biosynthesis